MGMRQFYRWVTPDDVDALAKDSDLLGAYCLTQIGGRGIAKRMRELGAPAHLVERVERQEALAEQLPPVLGIDKAWDGLRFLFEATPLDGAVMGLVPLGGEGSCGPARLVGVDRVRALEAAWNDAESLIIERFDPAAMAKAEVYPDIWEHEDAKPFLLDHAARLAAFYKEAADRGYAIISWTA